MKRKRMIMSLVVLMLSFGVITFVPFVPVFRLSGEPSPGTLGPFIGIGPADICYSEFLASPTYALTGFGTVFFWYFANGTCLR